WWQAPRPAPGEVDMLALDVGQGAAVLLRTAHHSLLFDAGPAWPGGDAGARVVQPLLQALGERLDMLVLSHGDADHVGGAEAVLAQ
ncbi:MBL fold metallo-hydrolase, partial [Comamonas terrigena]